MARHSQQGSSLIEVMVGVILLAVGMLAVLALVDVANQRSASTQSADGATGLAREVVERVREIPFDAVTPTMIEARLRALPGLAGEPDTTWRVARGNVVYAVTVSACAIDSHDDGIGTRTAERFCTLTSTPATGSGTSAGPALVGIWADLGLLDTQVSATLSGSLVDTVCNLAGPLGPRLQPTAPLLNAGATVLICPTGTQVAADPDSEDLKRVMVTVTPPRGRAVIQSTLVPNPDRLAAAQ